MSAQAATELAGATLVKRSRSVWAVLAVTSFLFLFSCGSLTLWLSSTLGNITTPQSATLEARTGSQLVVHRSHIRTPELVTEETTLNEGDKVETGSTGGAFLQLFDGSTIQTYFDTSLRIERLRIGKLFQNTKEASIVVNEGTVVVVTADLGGYSSARYLVATETGVIEPDVRSKVRLRVEGPEGGRRTSVFVDYGSARVLSRGRQIQVSPGTMARIGPDGIIEGPSATEEELLRNGNFTESPTSGAELVESGGLGIAAWLPTHTQPAEPVEEPGVASVVSETVGTTGMIHAAKFVREGTSEKYALVGIRQEVNQPVEFLSEIQLFATVKVVNQSQSAGGPQGYIYPLTIKVLYTDAEQKGHEWKQSFFYLGPTPAPAQTTKVLQGTWGQHIFTLKAANGGTGSDIAVINAIEVYGLGRQFQSWATNLSMMAR